MTEFPILRTERLLLRRFTQADLPQVFAGLSHPDVIRYYGVHYDSLEATQAQIDWFAQLEAEGTGLWWAICSADGQQFHGAGGVNGLQKEHRKAEIGFWLLPESWGKGIMQEAFPLICQAVFDHLNLHRIEGLVETHNTNCRRAMAKLGFTLEGTLQDCEIKDGKFISLDVYALLNPAERPH